MPELRDYQQQDVAAVIEAHRTHRSVIGRAATGLGKAVEIAALAQHYSQFGRVMILVDVAKLVRQLAATVQWYTGMMPGIEMADDRAANGDTASWATLWGDRDEPAIDRIIVSTVQTQYSGDEGHERYRRFDPKQFSALLLDECELFLAPAWRSVVRHYMDGNPDLRVFGCTATPFRSDKVAMANLFDHVAFDRDILWGLEQGWLVPARQAFIRVQLDFSTLSIRRDADGERDYSDDEIAEYLLANRALTEFGKGIVAVAEDRSSIVVCPRVDVARALTDEINAAAGAPVAMAIYGELSHTDKDKIFDAHQRGEFQYLVSVNMLAKGYDDPRVRAVFLCRKTQSRRMYQQIIGRGLRPWPGLVDGLADASSRREAIAKSPKPECLIGQLVGIDRCVKDMTLVDILGGRMLDDDAVAERARELMLDGMQADEAMQQAEKDIEQDRQQAQELAEAAAQVADAQDMNSIRHRFDIKALVQVEYEPGLEGHAAMRDEQPPGGIRTEHYQFLRKWLYPWMIRRWVTPENAGELCRRIMARKARGLCSPKQAWALQRYHGLDRNTAWKKITRQQAAEILDNVQESR